MLFKLTRDLNALDRAERKKRFLSVSAMFRRLQRFEEGGEGGRSLSRRFPYSLNHGPASHYSTVSPGVWDSCLARR